MNIGIIGAGAISKRHLNAFRVIPGATVTAICDVNEAQAKATAAEFSVPNIFTDYQDILSDPSIEAVSIVTPTFTHGKIVADALAAGKHVLCEKPPALTYEEALRNEEAAKASGKLLMYGFVSRFRQEHQLLKQFVEEGRLGKIYYAEASRMQNCSLLGGWFRDKTKSGGGQLMDAAIHQLDLLLWLIDYPEVQSVRGFTSDVNKDLPERIQGVGGGYLSAHNTPIPRTIESFATGYITFKDGRNLIIKAAQIANTPNPGTRFEILGDKGGVACEGTSMKFLTIDPSNYFVSSEPVITSNVNNFETELRHFVDCCENNTPCIPNAHQGTQLIRIMRAIYESAETGKEILF